jgi:hypothetical protein
MRVRSNRSYFQTANEHGYDEAGTTRGEYGQYRGGSSLRGKQLPNSTTNKASRTYEF